MGEGRAEELGVGVIRSRQRHVGHVVREVVREVVRRWVQEMKRRVGRRWQQDGRVRWRRRGAEVSGSVGQVHAGRVGVVGREWTDRFGVLGVEDPRVHMPVFVVVLVFACRYWSPVWLVSLAEQVSLRMVALFVVGSPLCPSVAVFRPVVVSVILNFSALVCATRLASVVALGLLLVARAHVPLRHRMLKPLEIWRLSHSMGAWNLVAHRVVEEVWLCRRPHVESRMVGALRYGLAQKRSADVLVGRLELLARRYILLLVASLEVLLVDQFLVARFFLRVRHLQSHVVRAVAGAELHRGRRVGRCMRLGGLQRMAAVLAAVYRRRLGRETEVRRKVAVVGVSVAELGILRGQILWRVSRLREAVVLRWLTMAIHGRLVLLGGLAMIAGLVHLR